MTRYLGFFLSVVRPHPTAGVSPKSISVMQFAGHWYREHSLNVSVTVSTVSSPVAKVVATGWYVIISAVPAQGNESRTQFHDALYKLLKSHQSFHQRSDAS